MENLKTDITGRDNLVKMLDNFYSRAMKDEILGPKFEHLAIEEHIEIIADFWDSILFGTNKYQGDPFGKHIPLDLQTIHFKRWLDLFNKTVDSMFSGTNADEAKHRASTIARMFQFKLTGK
jgi:hemoglobin